LVIQRTFFQRLCMVSAFIDTNKKQVAWKKKKNSFFNLLFHGKNKYIKI
jgi:hypothetical protein